MAGMGDMPMRPARPGPPMQHRGPPPMARLRPEPIDREKVSSYTPAPLLLVSVF
jgi:histone deacetylase complex subunit SAP18